LTNPGKCDIIDCREEKTPLARWQVDWSFVSFWHFGAYAHPSKFHFDTFWRAARAGCATSH